MERHERLKRRREMRGGVEPPKGRGITTCSRLEYETTHWAIASALDARASATLASAAPLSSVAVETRRVVPPPGVLGAAMTISVFLRSSATLALSAARAFTTFSSCSRQMEGVWEGGGHKHLQGRGITTHREGQSHLLEADGEVRAQVGGAQRPQHHQLREPPVVRRRVAVGHPAVGRVVPDWRGEEEEGWEECGA